ncbi:hypothetical protein ACTOB_002492 [Actinoplanes oblitus]|uniref:Uncharacterized protein n=1 Tax=Actinoplanes oblitus TaxID=3040509 RepID=A0ABY8WMZ8_9ACTN|nr:hypothetical protein [Actinoplanes oblitus]WIM98872.1 hypothetical protein ACTOB_002492 [Actinoplanes oblitus]
MKEKSAADSRAFGSATGLPATTERYGRSAVCHPAVTGPDRIAGAPSISEG